ncbi:MAG: class I SAM-dependent methyltransferase family protein [Thermoplasmata archaeon]|nr:class I SAM-dependent methyltransferase family protein [Thermoplasmata archaeon]
MLALRVERTRTEEARLIVSEGGILDKHHRIVEEGDFVEIPLLRAPGTELWDELLKLGAELIDEHTYAWRETFKRPFKDILNAIDLPEEKKELLPRRWELLGGVVILKVHPQLELHMDVIARTYASVLNACTVLRDTGGIQGEYREPQMDTLLGDATVTTHVENGVRYQLDTARLMFSSGNIDERIRMAAICKDGEVVVDMFAGIGYFSLPMAVHSGPSRIFAYDINPLAYGFLVKNVELNNVGTIIVPNHSDCLDAEEGVADRVVMGYVGTTHEYLPKALRILRKEGTVHYHETCPDRLLRDRPLDRITEAAGGEGKTCDILNVKTIKSYAPGVSHVVLDVKIE